MSEKARKSSVQLHKLLNLSDAEKIDRFERMAMETFSHVDGRDLLKQLDPRRTLDIKRRVDAVETWFEGDWLTDLFYARDGQKYEWDTKEIEELKQ